MWSKLYINLDVKYSLYFSDFNESWTVWTDFRKINNNQISRKSVQWEPSCSKRTDRRADGQRDRQTDTHTKRRMDWHDEANNRFSQFCGSAYKQQTLVAKLLFLLLF